MAFGQGTVVTGGYRTCPAMQRGTTVTTGLTAIKKSNEGQCRGSIWVRTGVHSRSYSPGGGIPLPDVRVRVGDSIISGVAGGGDVTGVTPAPPAINVPNIRQYTRLPRWGWQYRYVSFSFYSMSVPQCQTRKIQLIYVSPSAALPLSPIGSWVSPPLLLCLATLGKWGLSFPLSPSHSTRLKGQVCQFY